MFECKPVSTPMAIGMPLSKEQAPKDDDEKKFMSTIPYAEAVGSLVWMCTTVRPNIANSVKCLTEQVVNPGPIHWSAMKRLFRYLKGTIDHDLLYRGSDSNVHKNPAMPV